jgi:hypothetical protein
LAARGPYGIQAAAVKCGDKETIPGLVDVAHREGATAVTRRSVDLTMMTRLALPRRTVKFRQPWRYPTPAVMRHGDGSTAAY